MPVVLEPAVFLGPALDHVVAQLTGRDEEVLGWNPGIGRALANHPQDDGRASDVLADCRDLFDEVGEEFGAERLYEEEKRAGLVG